MSLTPVTVRNATDSFVKESRPSENYSGTTRLRLRTSTGDDQYAFIYFARPFPLGAVITSATLHLYADAEAGNWSAVSRTMTLKRVLGNPRVSTLTWNNKPSVTTTGSVAVTKTSAITDGLAWDFDVAALLQLVSDGTPWFGWRIELNDATVRKLYSANAGKFKPVLEVTYSDAPHAPTTLSPSGGRAVSVAKPVVRFDFTDEVGNTALNAVQVQINSTNVWTSPSFDSGTVATSDPQLDLATTAYAGMGAGTSTYWRVRVQDAGGQWSAWSDAALMAHQTKGTLTITNPSSGSPIVQEATPPILWSLSGRTQSAYQVIVTDTAGEWLYSSGKITSAATSHTLPAKIIHDGDTYTVIVRIWDTIEREGTPGQAAFTQASQSFTYTLSATVSPVTSFTGTDLSPHPAIQLDWVRATAPDSYTIVRDGKVIEAGVLPGDLLVSGTSYRYKDWGAHPNKSHTWQVRAVVNGVTSTSNPTVTMTLSPKGIWLFDQARDIKVQLMGDDPGTWGMGEQADVYEVLGSQKIIRITQSMRGFEGNITGILAADGATTLAQAEQAMYDLKEYAGRTYQLILSNLSLPVIIGNVVIAPSPEKEIIKRVSFDFWQVRDLTYRPRL